MVTPTDASAKRDKEAERLELCQRVNNAFVKVRLAEQAHAEAVARVAVLAAAQKDAEERLADVQRWLVNACDPDLVTATDFLAATRDTAEDAAA